QLSVKEDVAKLMEKRKILLELKSKQATLAADLDRLSDDLVTVLNYKLNLDGVLYEAEEAFKFL
ncbi:hypothetical protein A2U01_0053007, partial [Trifolium medium]|nr:hypothetical protein [Trifolium medium]